jgi:hypothetical protein
MIIKCSHKLVSKTVVLKLECPSELPRWLVKTQPAGPTTRLSDFACLKPAETGESAFPLSAQVNVLRTTI